MIKNVKSGHICVICCVLVVFSMACVEGNNETPQIPASPEDSPKTVISARLLDSGLKAEKESANKARELIEARLQGPEKNMEGKTRGAVDMSQAEVDYYLPSEADITSGTVLSDKELEIVDYGPRGTLPAENRRPVIYVMFNQAMVPLTRLHEPIRESGIMSMKPKVGGVFRWYGSKTLGFIPDEPLLEHPRFLFQINGATQALSGRELGQEFSFELRPEALKSVSFSCGRDGSILPINVPEVDAQHIVVEFNQEVDPGFISSHMKVLLKGKEMGFRVDRPDYPPELKSRIPRAILLVLNEKPPADSVLQIKILKGARPRKDYPATEMEAGFNVETIKPFSMRKVLIYRLQQLGERGKRHFVSVNFSHRLSGELDGNPLKLSLDGKPIEGEDISVDYYALNFYVTGMKPGQTLVVENAAGVRDVNGRSPVGGKLRKKVARPPAFINFPQSRFGLRHLEAQFGGKVGWDFQNLLNFRLGIKGRSSFYDYRNNSPLPAPMDISQFPLNERVFRSQDISKYLNADGFGTVFMSYVASKDPQVVRDYESEEEKALVAVQVTDLGLTVRLAYNRVLVWVNRLSDGTPVPAAEVLFFNAKKRQQYKALSDERGLAVIELPVGELAQNFPYLRSFGHQFYVQARAGSDLAEMKLADHHNVYTHGVDNTVWAQDAGKVQRRVYMFTDRKLYKAGEELSFRGINWLQKSGRMSPYEGSYKVTVSDDYGQNEIWASRGRTTESGGFFHNLQLPENLEPGGYKILYQVGGSDFREYFRVATFRRGTFAVEASFSSPHYYLGDELEADFAASYLSGGSLQDSDYHYFWSRRPVNFRPPGTQWKYWSFGMQRYGGSKGISAGNSTLSVEGKAVLNQVSKEHEIVGQTYEYTVEAQVENIDRQTVSRRVSALVHPSRYFLAARLNQGSAPGRWFRFVPVGKEMNLETVLTGVDGQKVDKKGRLRFGLIKEEWKSSRRKGIYGRLQTQWEQVREELWVRDNPLQKGRAELALSVEEPGSYILFVEFNDGSGGLARTEIDFYATGSQWVQRAARNPNDIKLTVEEEIYQPGDTARILVESPIPAGRYLLTIEREGILSEKIIALEGSNQLIEVPVATEYAPIFYVALSSYTYRTEVQENYHSPDFGRPRGLFGVAQINVSTVPFELDVEVKAVEDVYRPGAEADISVLVTRGGRPVADVELAVLATDRGVVDLVDYHISNPLDYFYDKDNFPNGVLGDDSRRFLLRPVTYELSEMPGGSKSASFMSMSGEESGSKTRKNFNPLAFFKPFLKTDAAGRVSFKAELPDTLTRYRLTAVAMKGAKLGYDENEFEVGNPIDVHASLPRRFRSRDTALAGVVISNKTDRAQTIRVSVDSDILKVVDKGEKVIVVPKKSVYELPFTLEAGKEGEGKIDFSIQSGVLNEVLENPVIVEEPLIVETVTTVGIVDGENPETEGLVIPGNIVQGYGSLGLEITTTFKPYISGDMKRIRQIRYPSASDKLYMLVAQLIESGGGGNANAVFRELRYLQTDGLHYDLKWGSSWFLSALAAQVAMQVSERVSGFENSLDMEMLYLYLLEQFQEARGKNNPSFMASWTAKILAEADKIDDEDMAWLVEAEDAVGLAGYSFLSTAYMAAGKKRTAKKLYNRALNFLNVGTRSVDLLETYEVKDYFSSRETELALLLGNMFAMNANDETALRVMMTLNSEKHGRRFPSMFDSYWVITAFLPVLDREGGSRDQGFTVHLADREIIKSSGDSEHEFSLTTSPLADLPREKILPLSIEGEGKSNITYAASLSYAVPNELVRARDEGVEVSRRYESLNGEVLNPQNLRAGETIRVRVTLDTPRRRSFLKLVVPVPSGTEIVDSSFATAGSYEDQGGADSEEWTRETVYGDEVTFVGDGYAVFSPGDWGLWFYSPVRKIYDNAVTYLWEDFYAGQREVSFLIQTTAPGIYPTPPVSASLQFEPEVFGRGRGELVIIDND